MFMKSFIKVFPNLLTGAGITILVTALAVFFGTLMGLILGMGRLSNKKIFNKPSAIYVDCIRGTPLLVQILIGYFGIPQLYHVITGSQVHFNPLAAAVVVCSINSGAYVAEIIRAGIQSIEKGQMEAARSLGMTHRQAMKHIVLPQAFRRIIPPLGNEFIILLKDTSLLSVIGVPEILQNAKLYAAATYQSFPAYIGAAVVYLVLTWSISRWVDYMEYKLGVKT